jgi:hypothetical protein
MNLKKIVQSNVSNLQNSLESSANKLAGGIKEAAFGALDPTGILRNLLKGPSSMPATKTTTNATVSGANDDWRVRLSMPSSFANDTILKPLILTNGLVFPYTPTILIQHTANYDSMQPVHSNYPFHNYQNSQIEDIVITGDFFCENAKDAQYWSAMVHYLRSATKMAYGQSENAGTPPPVVHLNGYGDFVFPNVPVIIRNFTVDLPSDVDYIKTQITGDLPASVTTEEPVGPMGFAPVQSQVAVTVTPIYSRAKVSQFNLNKFINGGYIGSNGNSGGGFI